MAKRRWARTLTRALGATGFVVVFGVAFVGAQSIPPPTPSDSGGWAIQSEAAPARNPFALAPADPGAIRYEELATTSTPDVRITDPNAPIPIDTYRAMSRESRASVDDTEAWAQTQNGPAVATAWSAYTDQMVGEAARQRAERAAGLTGAGDVGVE